MAVGLQASAKVAPFENVRGHHRSAPKYRWTSSPEERPCCQACGKISRKLDHAVISFYNAILDAIVNIIAWGLLACSIIETPSSSMQGCNTFGRRWPLHEQDGALQ